MRAITYGNARKNLRAIIQGVCKNAEPTIIVGSQEEEQVVMVSLDDFQAMEETAYLLSSPANRAHLERSLEQARNKDLVEFSTEDL